MPLFVERKVCAHFLFFVVNILHGDREVERQEDNERERTGKLLSVDVVGASLKPAIHRAKLHTLQGNDLFWPPNIFP